MLPVVMYNDVVRGTHLVTLVDVGVLQLHIVV